MTDIEAKALALVNEVLEGKALNNTPFTRLPTAVSSLVLLRAIEQHEAFRQEVSDVMTYIRALYPTLPRNFDRFIIPKPKPDPLVAVVYEALEAAPLIGATESAKSFKARQDAWLNGQYRAALDQSK
jgi:hypothetical protein